MCEIQPFLQRMCERLIPWVAWTDLFVHVCQDRPLSHRKTRSNEFARATPRRAAALRAEGGAPLPAPARGQGFSYTVLRQRDGTCTPPADAEGGTSPCATGHLRTCSTADACASPTGLQP
jgi:hypothetical protein